MRGHHWNAIISHLRSWVPVNPKRASRTNSAILLPLQPVQSSLPATLALLTSVKTSVSEARLRWLTELIFQIGHSVGILECQRRPPGLQMHARQGLPLRFPNPRFPTGSCADSVPIMVCHSRRRMGPPRQVPRCPPIGVPVGSAFQPTT